MTISALKTATATLAFPPTSGADPFSALAPAPSTIHEPWVAVARPYQRSNSGAATYRYEAIGDRIRRPSGHQPEPAAGYLDHIPVDIDPGAFPPAMADFIADMHEEGIWAQLDVKLRNVLRQLYAVGSGGSTFPLEPADTRDWLEIPRDLHDALHDLAEVREEAHEEGFPAPSDAAARNARRLLHATYGILPRRFEVYPTPDGEVAIDIPGGPGRSILLLCGSDGGALCSVNMNGAHRRARYSSARGLPDAFVREALAELERSNSATA